MTEYRIGTGGWSYFQAKTKPVLKAYSEHFSFTEVNYTFYKHPNTRMVERWRRTVPHDFTFTVRCHKDLTHRYRLKPIDEAYATASQNIAICRMLKAPFLHLLTPASYAFDSANIRQARDFFSSLDLKGVRLAWEARAPVTMELGKLMRDFNIVHSVDLSKDEPLWKSDVVYTRLFGKGKHNIYQFSDEELREIDGKILKAEARVAIVAYHGIRMNTDALRFKTYKDTGKFIPITAFTGIDSAKTVLQEDSRFPSTKTELVKHQGWKVIDLTVDKRVHISELLSKLPEKVYNNIEEVIEELEAIM